MRAITMSLPVRNLEVSRAFFADLGFMFSPELSGPDSACLMIDDNVRVLLLEEDRYRYHINGDLGDIGELGAAGSVLIRLPAGSTAEVDEIVMRAIVAGARPWPLADDGLGYSGSFQDPDGHLWQVVCPRNAATLEEAVPSARPAADAQIMENDQAGKPAPHRTGRVTR